MKSSISLVIIHLCSCAIDSTIGFVPRNPKTHRPSLDYYYHLTPQLRTRTSSDSEDAGLLSASTADTSNTPGSTAVDTDTSSNGGFRREFSPAFRLEFEELMHWRRDVRRFQKDREVDEGVLNRALSSAFHSAPSVGMSEPWRIVRVDSDDARLAALTNFREQNTKALEGYEGEKKRKYASLKLAGMYEAPVQLAIYCDDGTTKGSGLGARSMPEMRRYSVVSAITLFWLAARSFGLGVGWVSILDPVRLTEDLGVSSDWTLVGYLCVGWPEEDNGTPELERVGWENRTALDDLDVSSV
mmetsp:Transcript_21494/g.46909  ORF Transcript_21494/g.46909 Transcript_21494/m.46909 type:complete len:299 (+) Transcript_21494:215-1111(+)